MHKAICSGMIAALLAVSPAGSVGAASPAPESAAGLAHIRLLAVTDTLPIALPMPLPRLVAAEQVEVASLGTAPVPSVREIPVVPLPVPRPAITARQVNPEVDYDVLGSVAIRMGRLPNMPKWRHATRGAGANLLSRPCEPGSRLCRTRLVEALRSVLGPARSARGREVLTLVNRAVNHAITYRSDTAVWGVSDYWANAEEIALKGAGDCEDYAIAKLWALRRLGFPMSSLQLIVLDDTRTRAFHAVLGVHLDGRTYILDNLTDAVATDAAFPRYRPIMSFAAGEGFVHGFRTHVPALASLGAGLESAAPGEGH